MPSSMTFNGKNINRTDIASCFHTQLSKAFTASGSNDACLQFEDISIPIALFIVSQ